MIISKSFSDVAAVGKLSLDHLLKRYAVERRRRRMLPLYERALAVVTEAVQPAALLERFDTAVLASYASLLPDQSSGVVLAICTMGADIDQQVLALSADDPALGAVLEEILLAAVVGLTNLIHREQRQRWAAEEIKVGPPYRPGIGRWPIELQQLIFDRLPHQTIGVSLTESLVMLPRQSTTLVMPLLAPNTTSASTN